jgi:ketosteroid isomerase-like protein
MSKENVEIVRRCIDALNRRDIEALFELSDPDVEVDLSRNIFNPGVYVGREGVERWRAAVDEIWRELQAAPGDLIDAGEDVIAGMRMFGKGRGSGVEVEMTLFSVWSLHHGKVVKVAGGYRDLAQALAAVGLGAEDGKSR